MKDSIKNLEKKLLSNKLSNDERIAIYIELSEKYLQSNFNKSLEFALKSYELSQKGNNQHNIAISLNCLGVIYYKKNNFQKALEYYKKSLKISEEIHEKSGIASSLSYIGTINTRLGNYQEALQANFRALTIEEDFGNKRGIAKNFNNIGIIYKYLGNYEKALEYNFKALPILKEIGSKLGESTSYNNIGIIYKIKHDYDKAFEYYFLSLKINKQINDRNGMANAYNNIGICYQNLEMIDKSIEYFQKGLQIRKELNDERGISVLTINLAENYVILGNYELALQEALLALEIAKRIKMKPIMKNCYHQLSSIYSKIKDFEKATFYYRLFSEIKDSIYNEESSKKIAEMQTKYETEKKEREAEIFRLKNVELEEKVQIRTEELKKSNFQLQNEITIRKKAEEQIKKDLEEKKILLQELYHRTKNNMQIISSMLKMQSQYSKSEFIHSTFETINSRIKAMSLAQQKLYQAKELSLINLNEYIEDIFIKLRRSYSSKSENITLKLDLKEVFVLIDSAVPLGLVLTELITNIYQHAFPDNRKGEIIIRMFKDQSEMINIDLEDNGIGLPINLDPQKNKTIGFHTVFSLIESQLHGEIKWEIKNGVKWHIIFKDD
ncbi:MAG: tetratricopeptide repeat protein [Candidatus Cloacimonetes bacterium]|nr:tetratricopeptide repeat protein [Candidatus Cloacimonadota bacterium]